MSGQRTLMGPGPSDAPPEVLEALSRPLLGHLDPAFLRILDETAERLRTVFATSNRVTFAVSGTGSAGMEAALCNLLEPGDQAVVCRNGVFGDRMTEVASRCGASVATVDAPWGSAVGADALRQALGAHPDAKVVAAVHAETSTGAATAIDELAGVVRDHGALFVVDCVTSLAGMPVDVDGWSVDVAYAGTQKCISVPPGLAPITFSDRAVEVVRSRRTSVQSWYLDVSMLERYWGEERVYHHTAPVSMVRALHAGLGVVLDEGLVARWQRHAELAAELAKGLEALGFVYIPAPEHRLPMLHCVRVPASADPASLRRRLLEEYGIEIGAGLGAFRDDCVRIGLMGHTARRRNVTLLLGALDAILRL